MIQFLKKNRFGRATFLPLTNIRRRNSTISPTVLEDEGVIGIASTLVQVEERFQALVESLLGRIGCCRYHRSCTSIIEKE